MQDTADLKVKVLGQAFQTWDLNVQPSVLFLTPYPLSRTDSTTSNTELIVITQAIFTHGPNIFTHNWFWAYLIEQGS